MYITISKLRHLLAVARVRNFSQAAKELGISQPALSRSITSIEEYYEVRIFERGPGGISITPIGRDVIEEARSLMGAARAFDHNLNIKAGSYGGSIFIGFSPMIASMILSALCVHLLGSRPNVKIRASIRNARTLLSELINEDIDMFLCPKEEVDATDQITVQHIAPLEVAFIARSGHPLLSSARLSLADICGFPLLSAVEYRCDGLPVSGRTILCDNYDILRDITLNSDAVLISSHAAVAGEMSGGRLRSLRLVDPPVMNSEVSLVKRRGTKISEVAEEAVEFSRIYLSRCV